MSSLTRDVMPAPSRPEVEIVAGPEFELLVGLSAATTPDTVREESWVPPSAQWSRELRSAIDAVGTRSGEAWLHLLGLALELPSRDAATFVRKVARVPQGELRRHLVGLYVPAWVSMLGRELLERGAAGDADAIAGLLGHPRYYAGRASEALGPLLRIPPGETKRVVVEALRLFADEILAPREREIVDPLLAGAEAARVVAETLGASEVVSRLTEGYAYEPEAEFARVVLVPHLAARPSLLLCQHRESRVICYPLPREQPDPETALVERAAVLGRALGDESRVHILRYLAIRESSLDELATAAGLARSTAHHHLVQLRAARLVTLRGNAQRYTYALRADGLAEAQRALSELARAPSAPPKSGRPRRRSAGRPRRTKQLP